MGNLAIIQPMTTIVGASRGSGAINLASADPREIWLDSAVGSRADLTVDLASVRSIDTVWLGFANAVAGTTWAITAGVAAGNEVVVQAADSFRVPDVAGFSARFGHALWHGNPLNARYLTISVTQPAGAPPLSIGRLIVGRAFIAELGQEWGSGRRPIDTGTVTPLPSGGFAVVDGARKRAFSWTFGDLSQEETDRLELIALALGETSPGLVIEDVIRSAGLRNRIFYGLFERWRQYERRNRRQTRWEVAIEEWGDFGSDRDAQATPPAPTIYNTQADSTLLPEEVDGAGAAFAAMLAALTSIDDRVTAEESKS